MLYLICTTKEDEMTINLLKPKAIIAKTSDMMGIKFWVCITCIPCGKWMIWSKLLG